MDKFIDARFERVEKALATLIASISKYNPSPALAQDLVAADQELTDGLSLRKCLIFSLYRSVLTASPVSQHQQNTHTLASLQETSASLDAQIRDTLILLTSTRTALLETPASEFPEHTNQVEYGELLSYARRISKFTIPPDLRPGSKEDGEGKQDGSQTNGSATPTVTINTNGAANGNAMEVDLANPPNGANPPSTEPSSQPPPQSQTSLPAQDVQWLNTRNDYQPFVPWVREEELRRGALSSIEKLITAGIDPEGYDPDVEEQRKKEEAEELERKAEEERVAEEEKRKAAEERRANALASGGGHHGGSGGAPKPKVFQLEEFDDEDD
jgi:hypothetical protein